MKADPTKTIVIRNRAERKVNKRFNAVKRDAVAYVKANFLVTNISFGEQRVFEFTRSEDRVADFDAFLQQRIDEEILRVDGLTLDERSKENHWLNREVGEGYRRGAVKVRLAAERAIPSLLKLADYSPFANPKHVERAQLIFQRTYSDLEGVTQVMAKQMSRELSNGILLGHNPVKVAQAIAEKVDNIGLVRARLIARTEIIESHNSASIKEAEVLEAETGVKIQMEWITAGDSRVRSSHQDRDGNVYSRAEAQDLIGEPNCRCSISPVFDV